MEACEEAAVRQIKNELHKESGRTAYNIPRAVALMKMYTVKRKRRGKRN